MDSGGSSPISALVTVRGAAIRPVTSGVDITVSEAESDIFLRGDANDDGKSDIADPIWILNELFGGGQASPCQRAADANDDGALNLTDAVHVLLYLFRGGEEPPAPGPEECGRDVTADTLESCEEICP